MSGTVLFTRVMVAAAAVTTGFSTIGCSDPTAPVELTPGSVLTEPSPVSQGDSASGTLGLPAVQRRAA